VHVGDPLPPARTEQEPGEQLVRPARRFAHPGSVANGSDG